MVEVLMDPELWADHWFKNNKKSETLNNYLLSYDRELSMFNAYQVMNGGKGIKGKSSTLLTCAFEAFIELRPVVYKREMQAIMLGHKQNLAPLEAWLMAVTGQCLVDELHVMAHWAWLVKRHMAGLAVVHHIMPIVTSPKQGGGKSTAVRLLYAPLKKLAIELKIKQAVDERAYTLFANYLVGFFDEMAGADKVDSNDIKSTLSSDELSYRPMRTNVQLQIKNSCSFIGTSNNELYENIKDTTGIRRFYPINALAKLNHELINSIDYTKLWQGIDETRERGYLEDVQELVNANQAKLQMQEELQIFLDDNFLMPEPGKPTKQVSGKDLFMQYQKFAVESGIRFPLHAQTFYKRIRSKGIQGEKARDKNKSMTWFFEVNGEAYLEFTKSNTN